MAEQETCGECGHAIKLHYSLGHTGCHDLSCDCKQVPDMPAPTPERGDVSSEPTAEGLTEDECKRARWCRRAMPEWAAMVARAESAEAERDDLRAALDRVKATDFASVLRAHLPRDRYRDDGEAIGTYCTCGEWTGDYFADGEAGPFDDHLAAVLRAAVKGGRP